MTLSKYDKDIYVREVVLKQFSFLQHANVGAMLLDTDYNILAVNELCQSRFGEVDLVGVNNLATYHENNDVLLNKCDSHGVSYAKYVEAQNKIRLRLHQIVIQEKLPVQFVCFMPHTTEFKSLLVQYMPIFHNSSEVVAIQVLASEFSFWGIQEYLNFLDMRPVQQVGMLLENQDLPIKLTVRQHEILFLLATQISQRQVAQILNISYGYLSRIVRDVICPKFGINDADVTNLIVKARKMDYHRYIPQSLCRPVVIVLDNTIWDKYFVEDSWIFPNWTKG